jgi:hypothetical protein
MLRKGYVATAILPRASVGKLACGDFISFAKTALAEQSIAPLQNVLRVNEFMPLLP